jgi:hypothetical protein
MGGMPENICESVGVKGKTTVKTGRTGKTTIYV